MECVKCPRSALCADGFCLLRGWPDRVPNCSFGASNSLEFWSRDIRGRLVLQSCPTGHELVTAEEAGSEELQECKACTSGQYILQPNTGECTPCPPGLVRFGRDRVQSALAGSHWTIDTDLYRLVSCPAGRFVSAGAASEFVAASQKCEPCERGAECVTDNCSTCAPCQPGYYKSFVGAQPCQACPADTYNPEVGAAASSQRVSCPAHSSTRGHSAQSARTSCDCDDAYYLEVEVDRPLCVKCPTGALCESGVCALRSYPDPGCPEDSERRAGPDIVVGVWEVDTSTGRFVLAHCPSKYEMVTAESAGSEEPQECRGCLANQYIIDGQQGHRCWDCPRGSDCVEATLHTRDELDATGELEVFWAPNAQGQLWLQR